MIASLVLGIIALVSGLALRYWINRRKFNRRAATGAEGFSNYERSVAITIPERIGKWVAWISIIFGVLFLCSYRRQKREKEKPKYAAEVVVDRIGIAGETSI